jgi:protein FAM50
MEEMKRTQELVMEQRAKKLVQMEESKKMAEKERIKAKKEKKAKEKIKQKTLSFNPDGEDEEENSEESVDSDADFKRKGPEVELETVKRKRFGMNPDVATAFLPDREREEEENLMREKLRLEWERRQRGVREEMVDIVYSYWDGSGHKNTVSVKKGNTVYQFLCKVLDNLRTEFSELKIASGDDLMFVKDDLIIPQTNTFYDFIVTQARGKGGLLFNFDQTPEALELVEEAGMHVAKVIHRSWYTRNKHIFPANRWEPFDPTKVTRSSSPAVPP